MKLTTTKKMVSELNKAIPEYHFSLDLINTGWFADDRDYDYKTGKTKVISVWYPAEYYALPKQLSTTDLEYSYKRSNRTWDGFIQSLRQDIEI